MLEIRQGAIEAFRFASRGKVVLKEVKIAGDSIPSDRALLLSRVVDFAVLLVLVLWFSGSYKSFMRW